MKPGPARTLLRLLAALLLMALAVHLVGWERLRAQLAHVERWQLAAAVVAAGLAQCVSVLRWETIARIFGLRVRTRALAIAYAQGMTLNVLLPGATLGGDALRSLRLQALGNPLGTSALTVLLDRLSGLWVLCVLSLATGAGLAVHLALAPAGEAAALPGADVLAQALPWVAAHLGTQGVLLAYLAGLSALCAVPWLPLRPAVPAAAGTGWARRLLERLRHLHDLAVAERVPLVRSIWSSVLVQVLCATTLWLCARAAGSDAGFWQVQAVAAPVFIAGALPLSYGGFGLRELTALVVFPVVGVAADVGLAASALYGFAAVILGLLTAPSFVLPAQGGPAADAPATVGRGGAGTARGGD